MKIHENERKSYEQIIPIGYGYFKVLINGLYGIIDQEGLVIIPPRFDNVYDFHENGIALLKKDGKYGFINNHCEIILEPISEYLLIFVDGLSIVKVNNKQGIIDKDGNTIIEPKYDRIEYFHDNLAKVEIGNKCGFVNKAGEEVVAVIYDSFERLNGYISLGDFGSDPPFFQNNMVKAKLNGKWGMINQSGKVVLPIEYDYIGKITPNSFSYVKLNGKIGLISLEGKELIPPRFDRIESFKDGYAQIKDGGKVGLINDKFSIILEPKYNAIFDFVNGFAIVCNHSYVRVDYDGYVQDFPITYYGFINMNGKEIVAPNIYTKATNFEKGFAEVYRSNFYGKILIDEEGKESLFPYKN